VPWNIQKATNVTQLIGAIEDYFDKRDGVLPPITESMESCCIATVPLWTENQFWVEWVVGRQPLVHLNSEIYPFDNWILQNEFWGHQTTYFSFNGSAELRKQLVTEGEWWSSPFHFFEDIITLP
jgi:hypothetical protein